MRSSTNWTPCCLLVNCKAVSSGWTRARCSQTTRSRTRESVAVQEQTTWVSEEEFELQRVLVHQRANSPKRGVRATVTGLRTGEGHRHHCCRQPSRIRDQLKALPLAISLAVYCGVAVGASETRFVSTVAQRVRNERRGGELRSGCHEHADEHEIRGWKVHSVPVQTSEERHQTVLPW